MARSRTFFGECSSAKSSTSWTSNPQSDEEARTGGVGHLRREPLAQRTVTEQRLEPIVGELTEKLVLAAGDGEDDLCAEPHRTVERSISRRVAGMQADDEVGRLDRGARDVPELEAQALRLRAAGRVPHTRRRRPP